MVAAGTRPGRDWARVSACRSLSGHRWLASGPRRKAKRADGSGASSRGVGIGVGGGGGTMVSVPTLLLIRHGLTAATGHTLSGWTPGLHLDERGTRQAEALRDRLRRIPLAAFVVSPLERCVETASIVRGERDLELVVDERLGEVRYGDWTGRELKALAREPLWKVVQAHPSAAAFPGGEALREMQTRAVGAVRDWNERVGDEVTWALCSHGDILKAILADALGMHLDQFQRIHVDPASLSVVRYTPLRPFVVRLNDVGGDVSDLLPPKKRRRRSRDAIVGGGAGGQA